MRNLTTKSALHLIDRVCHRAGARSLIGEVRDGCRALGLDEAVRRRDTTALFNWLSEVLAFQGVSDAAAAGFIRNHGTVDRVELIAGLACGNGCPKLQNYWAFDRCGFHKGTRTCQEPDHIDDCLVPRFEQRNGRLNQTSVALHLFLRDVADDDVVGWIDARLAPFEQGVPLDRVRRAAMRGAVLEPLSHIHGTSRKVWSMALADLMLGADPGRMHWVETGASMIAIDTLVHNWLHRTGILASLGVPHPYGPRCYGPGGCADIIERAADAIDARPFHPDYPTSFPRFVQRAIWWFCAQAGLDECNGNQVDDRGPCTRLDCGLADRCRRIPLRG